MIVEVMIVRDEKIRDLSYTNRFTEAFQLRQTDIIMYSIFHLVTLIVFIKFKPYFQYLGRELWVKFWMLEIGPN